jgi:hypothetical protein
MSKKEEIEEGFRLRMTCPWAVVTIDVTGRVIALSTLAFVTFLGVLYLYLAF